MPSSSLKQASCLKLQPSWSTHIPQTLLISLQNKFILNNFPLSYRTGHKNQAGKKKTVLAQEQLL